MAAAFGPVVRTHRRSAQIASQSSGRRRTKRTSASRSRASSPATKPTSRGGSRGGAASGQRQQQLLELVRSRPGITVREAGTEFGVDPTGLYRVVSRLEKSGELRKNGRQLEPASTAT